MKKIKIGILGGVGPLATVYFQKLLIENTPASKDQDHLDTIVINQGSIPDRTDFILGKSKEDPSKDLIHNAQCLEKMGADFLLMPCNTGHYFFEAIQEKISIPMIHMVKETVQYAREQKAKKIGFLATDGSLKIGLYANLCREYGLEYIIPDEKLQKKVMSLIYDQVKANKPLLHEDFDDLVEEMYKKGCDHVILGCTELSIFYAQKKEKDPRLIDSLSVLAKKTIEKAQSVSL